MEEETRDSVTYTVYGETKTKTKTKAQLVVVGWQFLLLLWKDLILQVRSTNGAKGGSYRPIYCV